MATRSGKRIRSMFQESTVDENVDITVQSERKTRSKRIRENTEDLGTNVIKGKKRNNYVHYPTDDEQPTDTVESEDIKTRSTRKNTLKDRNTIAVSSENIGEFDAKHVRTTRRTKKISESNLENAPLTEKDENKTNKNKKKRKSNDNTEMITKKTKSRKKKVKKSTSTGEFVENEVLNKSNTSNDTYHSATESPTVKKIVQPLNTALKKLQENHLDKETVLISEEPITLDNNLDKKKRKSSIKNVNSTFEIEPKQSLQRKSSIKNTTDIAIAHKKQSIMNISHNIDNDDKSSKEIKINTTFEIDEVKQSPIKRKSSVKSLEVPQNETLSKINTTYDKNDSTTNINVTYEKVNISDDIDVAINTEIKNTSEIHSSAKKRKSEPSNTTFDKELIIKESRRSSVLNSINRVSNGNNIANETFEVLNQSVSGRKSTLNNTFDKINSKTTEITNKDSTFDVNKTEEKLNATFEKTSQNSLISTDSENQSRISITSDDSSITPNSLHDSKTLMNTTPVLIESSIDESFTQKHTPETVTLESVTPLKREGTFTKDGPVLPDTNIIPPTTPKRTPVKHMSLPSPGHTPFPNKSPQKDRILNVTRSIEKSRRSSLSEAVPRTTKVMFCSPIDNPVMASQQKRKIIKSNLKGSNKSFVVQDNDSVRRPTARKRSYTQNDAEEARRKRKCASEAAEPPRKRTFSATAKLPEPATPKRIGTPSKSKPDSKVSRTKLPNFAALHQKQFAKMESLDECQERKAKRAKQLLTPTGNLTVLERISPKSSTELQKEQSKNDVMKTPYNFKINHESKPGYSRFGFKLNMEVNPFSVPTKNNQSKVVKKPALIRQATLPSLTGTTSARREVAKQVVMREKSFTDKRTGRIQESRTIIKGVRTNRRFDLQMRLRNLD